MPEGVFTVALQARAQREGRRSGEENWRKPDGRSESEFLKLGPLSDDPSRKADLAFRLSKKLESIRLS